MTQLFLWIDDPLQGSLHSPDRFAHISRLQKDDSVTPPSSTYPPSSSFFIQRSGA